jgi:hypothetical protein
VQRMPSRQQGWCRRRRRRCQEQCRLPPWCSTSAPHSAAAALVKMVAKPRTRIIIAVVIMVVADCGSARVLLCVVSVLALRVAIPPSSRPSCGAFPIGRGRGCGHASGAVSWATSVHPGLKIPRRAKNTATRGQCHCRPPTLSLSHRHCLCLTPTPRARLHCKCNFDGFRNREGQAMLDALQQQIADQLGVGPSRVVIDGLNVDGSGRRLQQAGMEEPAKLAGWAFCPTLASCTVDVAYQ